MLSNINTLMDKECDASFENPLTFFEYDYKNIIESSGANVIYRVDTSSADTWES